MNNSNTAGVISGQGTAADQTAAGAVTTGFELAIPLAQLGSPTGTIKVLVDINGNNDNFLSNQFLTGLGSLTGNIGNGGKFDFSATNNQFFTVTVPAGGNNNGVWQATGGGSFGDSANWVGGVVPIAAGDSALFSTSISAPELRLTWPPSGRIWRSTSATSRATARRMWRCCPAMHNAA